MAEKKSNNEVMNFTFTMTKPYNVHSKAMRANQTMTDIKNNLKKYTKNIKKPISISSKVNELVFAKGIRKPPRRIELKAVNEEEKIFVYLKDEQIAAHKKEKAKESKEKKEAKQQEPEEKKEKADIVKEMERAAQ